MNTASYTTDSLLFTTTISPTNSNSGVGPITLGTVPYDMLVELEVNGMLNQYYSQAMTWYNPDPDLDKRGDLKGPLDAGGYFDFHTYCSAYVSVSFRKPDGWYKGGASFCEQVEPAFRIHKYTYTQLSVVQGAGTANWTRGPNGVWSYWCGTSNDPCWTFDGSFTLTVKRIKADLLLTASATAVEPGDVVSFTAAIDPTSVGGLQVPYSNVTWRWEDSTGSNTLSCSQLTCSRSVTTTGTMIVQAIVNGVAQEEQVDVIAIPCPTGDSILDHRSVRTGLQQALEAAQDSLKELAIVIYRDGHNYVVQAISLPGANECSTPLPIISQIQGQGFDVIATAHPHLYPPGTLYTCTGYSDPVRSPDGLGSGDWKTWQSLQRDYPEMPHYIIDPINVFPIRPGMQFGDPENHRIVRSTACGWA